jgi:hypothetical protein
MAFSPATLAAPSAMENPAIQQRTPQDLGRIGQLVKKLLPRLAYFIVVHQ